MAPDDSSRKKAVIVLAFLAFISLGLPDGLLGVAWPGIRRSFDLPIDALGIFLIFSTAGYTTSSFFSGVLVRKLGVGSLLAASCAATAVALGIYSFAPSWWVFVGFGLLGGFGAGAIDAGLNTYVDRNHSERLMQWLHASFGVGITLGPLIMTTGIELTGRWQPGYRVVSIAQLILASAFLLTRGLWHRTSPRDDSRAHKPTGGAAHAEPPGAPAPAIATTAAASEPVEEASIWQSALHLPSLMSMVLFIIYTGVELGLGLWAYTFLTEARGVGTTIAGLVTGSYWATFTVGRILAGVYSGKVKVQRLVAGGIILAMACLALVWLNAGTIATVAGIALTGFAVAPVFPGMLSDTRNRVKPEHLSNTIGMQIAAAGIGAAILPALTGVTARLIGLEAIPVFLLLLLVVLLMVFGGFRLRSRRSQRDARALS